MAAAIGRLPCRVAERNLKISRVAGQVQTMLDLFSNMKN